MQALGDLFKAETKAVRKGLPGSERALVIQDMADLAGVPFTAMMRKTFHLPGGEATTRLLKSMYEEAMMEDDRDGGKWRRIKLWQLVRRSDPARDDKGQRP